MNINGKILKQLIVLGLTAAFFVGHEGSQFYTQNFSPKKIVCASSDGVHCGDI